MIFNAKKREKDLAYEKEHNIKHRSFFETPYGTTVCNCGGKVVAHGRCQTCFDKLVENFARETKAMTGDKNKYDKMVKKMNGNKLDFDTLKKKFRFTRVS
jgi:hypothetical protein